MEHNLRHMVRKTKDVALGYSDVEGKVREATSNDPWGAPAALLEEIAHATDSPANLKKIMEMIWKRMNDSGKNWRHVMKALTLLDYLIKNGSDYCVDYARNHIHEVSTLREFQFVDENGKDQGVNVRHKSKEIASLLNDRDRVREEREKARLLRQRLSSNANYSGGYGNSDYIPSSYGGDSRSSYGGDSRTSYGGGGGGGGASRSYSGGINPPPPTRQARDEEDPEIQRALRESQASYEAEQELRKQRSDEEVRRAMEASKKETQRADPFADSFAPPNPARSYPSSAGFGSDSFGGAPSHSTQGSFGAPRSAQQASDPFGGSSDPFGSSSSSSRQNQQSMGSFGGPSQGSDPFGGSSASDPFGGGSSSASSDPFGGSSFGGSAPRQSGTKPQNDQFGFSSAFDGGNEAKKMPHMMVNENDPNAKLAAIARNSQAIDPFAQMASSRTANSSQSSSFSQPPPMSNFGGSQSSGMGAFGGSQSSSMGGFGGSQSSSMGGGMGGFGGSQSSSMGGFGAPQSPSMGGGMGGFGGSQSPSMAGGYGAPRSPSMGGGYGGSQSPSMGGFGGSQSSMMGGGYGGQRPQSAVMGGYGGQQASNPFGSQPQSPDPFGDVQHFGGGEILAPEGQRSSNGSNKSQAQFQGIVNLENLGTRQHSNNPFATKSSQFDWGTPKPNTASLNSLKSQGQGF